jgi:hypothetical protein
MAQEQLIKQIVWSYNANMPVTVAERAEALSVFVRGFESHLKIDIWRVCAFILCLCSPVFR